MTESRPLAPAGRPTQFALSWALVFLTVPSWIVIGFLIASVASAVVWIGLGLWLVTLGGLHGVTNMYRDIAGRILGERFSGSYVPSVGGGILARVAEALTSPARWRDVLYAFFAVTLGFAIGLACVIGFFIFPVGYFVSPWLLRTWATLTRNIIGPTGEQALQERIGQLQESRSESLDHSAAELRRIERDLHDGAQAQLVALGMRLGLAEELLTKDPNAAATLITEARMSSQSALQDIRSLVRGIHPPVLADRGLPGGIEALSLQHPRTVDLDIRLNGRPPASIESAVYFAVAEALTNIAKHAAAEHTWVTAWHDGAFLTVLVGDDGVGGADFTTGGGLAGLRRRIEAFDGSITVGSPIGGPTVVTITVPCEVTASPVSVQEGVSVCE